MFTVTFPPYFIYLHSKTNILWDSLKNLKSLPQPAILLI